MARKPKASVIAKTATASDGFSTTLFLLGPDSGTRVVHELPGTAALWVSAKGETRLASTGPKILVQAQFLLVHLARKIQQFMPMPMVLTF